MAIEGRDDLVAKAKPLAVFTVEPWHMQVAAFGCSRTMKRYFDREFGLEVPGHGPSNGLAGWLENDAGVRFYYLYLSDEANLATLVHECTHVMDFIHESVGVPSTYDNLELRGYQIGQIVHDAARIFGFPMERTR